MGWQFYNSLACGAQGIMYFRYRKGGMGHYGAPVDELGNRGPLFVQLQRQHTQFTKEWAWRYRDCRPVATYHWPHAPVGLRIFDGRGIVRGLTEDPSTLRRPSVGSHLVVGEFLDGRQRPHVLLANGPWEEHTFVHLTAHGKGIRLIAAEGVEQNKGKPDGDTVSFSTHMMPGQAVFFRVEQ